MEACVETAARRHALMETAARLHLQGRLHLSDRLIEGKFVGDAFEIPRLCYIVILHARSSLQAWWNASL